MSDHKVTAWETARMLELLQAAKAPMTSAVIAEKMPIYGKRESLRRRIRAIATDLRNHGSWVIAENPVGYWLTDDAGQWKEYLEGRMISGKRCIADASKKKRVCNDQGQGVMFVPPVPAV